MWGATPGLHWRGDRRNGERKPVGHHRSRLLQGLRQGQSYPAHPQVVSLRHRRYPQCMARGISGRQTAGSSGGWRQVWLCSSRLRCPPRLSPRTNSLPHIQKWSTWRHQVPGPSVRRRHNVQQNHQHRRRPMSAPRRSSLPYHLGGAMAPELSSPKMHRTEVHPQAEGKTNITWTAWTCHWKRHHQKVSCCKHPR